MHRYFIKLSYNGSQYHGWQVQENSVTVQSELENALAVLFGENIATTGAGRTDAGVHAKEFFAHFDYSEKLNNEKIADLIYRLNAILSDDIAVQDIIPVTADAHARFSAISRTYRYYICRHKDPFHREDAWNVYGNLDVKKMNEAAKILFEYSDFTSFSKLNTDTKTNNCKIMKAEWNEEKELLVFTITADRFLRNMVRSIVGTIVDLGKGKISIADFKKIIEAKDRGEAGYSVPAKGLFLEEIEYPEGLIL